MHKIRSLSASTAEPLYSGHHWDPAGCPVYSGTSVLYTVEPLYRDTIGTRLAVLFTVEPLYRGTTGTRLAVLFTVEPLYRGTIGTRLAVLYREVSLIQR